MYYTSVIVHKKISISVQSETECHRQKASWQWKEFNVESIPYMWPWIPLLYVASFLLFSLGLQHVKGFKKPSKLSFDIELSVHEIECRLATQMVHILFSLGNMIWLIVKCQQRYIKSQHFYWCDLILIATQEIHKESCSNWPRNIFVAVFDDWVVQYSLYVQTAAWLAGRFGGNKVLHL